jgi:hypothetical protein
MRHIAPMRRRILLSIVFVLFCLVPYGQSSQGQSPFLPITPVVPGPLPAEPEPIIENAPIAQAVGFEIDRYVVAGGGGPSAGGTFSLVGTVGQAAAGGALTGATYSLTSGFWAMDTGTTTPTNKRRGQITSQDEEE